MRLSTILALALSFALVSGAALAQGFPDLSFDQLIAIDRQLILQQKKPERPGDLFFNPGENGGGKTRAVYTGQSRAIDPRKEAFINAFASTSVGNSQYAALFEREYRFTAGGKDWWLPVQSQVASYFGKELKAGQPVTLYIRNAGGFRGAAEWDWIFLVEEYDTPSGAKDAPPEKGKPGARKLLVIPPGPKIAT